LAPSKFLADAEKPRVLPRSPMPSIAAADLAKSEIFPKRTFCSLRVSLDSEKIGEIQHHHIKWYKSSEYKRLYDVAADTVAASIRDRSGANAEDELYVRYGLCRVIGREHEEVFTHVDDCEALSDTAIKDICGFIGAHAFEKFDLEISWDWSYSSLKRDLDPGVEFTEMMRGEIYHKCKKNFLNQSYLPRIDVGRLKDAELIRKVIDADRKLDGQNKPPFDRKFFANQVILHAPRLFLTCVYLDRSMAFLKHLIDFDYSDQSLPDISHLNSCPRSKHCEADLEMFVVAQYGFFAKKIEGNKEVMELNDHEVMPIAYGNNGKEIGSGSFSIVKSIFINPFHHYLPGVSTRNVNISKTTV